MRTNTVRNITRICRELNLEVCNVTPEAVKLAWQPRTCLPDDEWKAEMLAALITEWQKLKAAGKGEDEKGKTLELYIFILCDM